MTRALDQIQFPDFILEQSLNFRYIFQFCKNFPNLLISGQLIFQNANLVLFEFAGYSKGRKTKEQPLSVGAHSYDSLNQNAGYCTRGKLTVTLPTTISFIIKYFLTLRSALGKLAKDIITSPIFQWPFRNLCCCPLLGISVWCSRPALRQATKKVKKIPRLT